MAPNAAQPPRALVPAPDADGALLLGLTGHKVARTIRSRPWAGMS